MKQITKKIEGYEFSCHSGKELTTIFSPESKQVIRSALAERQEEYDRIAEEVKIMFLKVKKEAPRDMWFYEILAEKMPEYIPKLLDVENHIYRLKWELATLKSKPSKQYQHKINFQEKILIARRYPIAELARSKLELKPSGKNSISLCFSHQEKRPSLYLYFETNTFVCFGCGLKGDVITLTMHLYGLSFRETVEMLQN